jgi:hypothetical protein
LNAGAILPKKWVHIRPEDIGRLEDELARETVQSHPLYGAQVKAIYRRYPHDDVLFEVHGLDCPYYCVHLTWAKETKPSWPFITRFSSIEDFCQNYEMTLEVTEGDARWPREKWRFYERDAT